MAPPNQIVDLTPLINGINNANATARQALAELTTVKGQNAALEQELRRMQQNHQDLQNALSRVQIQARAGDPNIQRVENIPGRRVPFDMLVDIAIPAASTAARQGTITISQEGPFVAVARMATLISAFEFQVTPPGTSTAARFQGRSFGRYRPMHSAWDLNDGQILNAVSMIQAFPGTGAPHIASPSNASPFRSMEGDFRIMFVNAGSSFPRSNQEVPSTFWSRAINEPWELGALDFFERGEVLQFTIAPTHPPNPAFGNLSGFSANPSFPFVDSGWDAVEGINDQAQTLDDPAIDPVQRQPNMILTIGFHGYRIIQPAGAGQY